ncbi:LEF-8 [Crangon crangon nudivirus]|uniref:LEF-8 n=1 Tax=Crangon crangon nudivirus TaxID=2880838 RepID=A0AAE9BYL4_9VIRU|nr:LEF-8 [Crangon crangon nudivirus]UBZ25499.1 LEF-8 [Crangon crangon nudivirus]
MANIYTAALLQEYNGSFSSVIISDCPCYAIYQDFNNHIYMNKQSYLCCLLIYINKEYRAMHKRWPIMLGSYIDKKIRPNFSESDSSLFGCFVIEGVVKIIYNFITNNLTTGHVRRIKRPKKPDGVNYTVRIKTDAVTMNLVYCPADEENPITATIYDEAYKQNVEIYERFNCARDIHKDETSANNKKLKGTKVANNLVKNLEKSQKQYNTAWKSDLVDRATGLKWIDVINMASPFRKRTEEDYIQYFKSCINNAPQLDDMANKTVISPNTILLRFLKLLINNVVVGKIGGVNESMSQRFTRMNTKLASTIRSGNMFYVLSNKIVTTVSGEYNDKSVYQTIEGQKQHIATYMTSVVKRFVNSKTKNSKALMFSRDAYQYICPIDIKDIKGAGENISLAQLVFSPPGIDIATMQNIIKSFSKKDGELTVVINSFITLYRLNREDIKQLKLNCPILPIMIYDNYLVLNIKGHVLMKYSTRYNFFVTPYELHNFWPDAFDDYHHQLKYSPTTLHLSSLIDTAASVKRNVANANLKGRCNELHNEFTANTFLYSVGASNAAIIHKREPEDKVISIKFNPTSTTQDPLIIPIDTKAPHLRYLQYAKVANPPPLNVEEKKKIDDFFANYVAYDDGTELNGCKISDVLDDADTVINTILKIFQHWHTDRFTLAFTYGSPTNNKLTKETLAILQDQPECKERNIVSVASKSIYIVPHGTERKEYSKTIAIDVNKPHPPHMALYVAFGDIGGGTNEDGIVIDKDLAEFGPKKLISQSLTVKFTPVNKKTGRLNFIYHPQNSEIGGTISFGVVTVNEPMTYIKSKNVNIEESHIGKNYRYMISTYMASHYTKVIGSSSFTDGGTNINIHVHYLCNLGVGMKISNNHGQKGIISAVRDLSHLKAYRRDGTCVKPQLLFSITSIIGRTVSSQVLSMFSQPDIAISPTLCIVSPQGINWHNIEPSIKSRASIIKNDLMMAENGLLANHLPFVSDTLRSQGPIHSKKNPLHLVQQLSVFQGIRIEMLTFSNDVIDEVY